MGYDPYSSKIVVLFYVLFVLCRFVYIYFFLCRSVLFYCHLVATQLQLTKYIIYIKLSFKGMVPYSKFSDNFQKINILFRCLESSNTEPVVTNCYSVSLRKCPALGSFRFNSLISLDHEEFCCVSLLRIIVVCLVPSFILILATQSGMHQVKGMVLKSKVLHEVWCTRWRSWLRHCATSRKVTGPIPDGVIGIFHWHNPSGRTMALGLTQPLTEMHTKNFLEGKAAGA